MVSLSKGLCCLVAVVAARPPPTCEPTGIQQCLNEFEAKYSACETNDTHCHCTQVITTGANCFAPCPQEAMTTFIQTVDDGLCANFDPFLRKRSETSGSKKETIMNQWLGIREHVDDATSDNHTTNGTLVVRNALSKKVSANDTKATKIRDEANTVSHVATSTQQAKEKPATITTPLSDASAITSLSPEEYHSQLEKSRYKANLRSIRSSRARLSSEAENRRLAEATKHDAESHATIAKSSAATSVARTRPSISSNTSTSAAPRTIMDLWLLIIVMIATWILVR